MRFGLIIAFSLALSEACLGQDAGADVFSEEILIESLEAPEYLELLNDSPKFEESAVQEQAATGRIGHLRALDRSTGRLMDFGLAQGEKVSFGRIDITLRECRFPTANPAGDAYLSIDISSAETQIFNGWMVASSPALSALDHARYDVWALRCTTE